MRVCTRQRKKREGKKKGRADSYFSTVATGLRGVLTIHSDCSQVSVSHTSSRLVSVDPQQHTAHHHPAHMSHLV